MKTFRMTLILLLAIFLEVKAGRDIENAIIKAFTNNNIYRMSRYFSSDNLYISAPDFNVYSGNYSLDQAKRVLINIFEHRKTVSFKIYSKEDRGNIIYYKANWKYNESGKVKNKTLIIIVDKSKQVIKEIKFI